MAERRAESTRTMCSATTKAGKPCPWPALKGSSFCYRHDPAKEEERREACRKGGSTVTAKRKRAKTYSIGTLQALVESMSEVFSEVKAGTLTWRQGSALAAIGNVILSALKAMREKDATVEEVTCAEDATNRIRELYGLPPIDKKQVPAGGNGTSC